MSYAASKLLKSEFTILSSIAQAACRHALRMTSFSRSASVFLNYSGGCQIILCTDKKHTIQSGLSCPFKCHRKYPRAITLMSFERANIVAYMAALMLKMRSKTMTQSAAAEQSRIVLQKPEGIRRNKTFGQVAGGGKIFELLSYIL